MSVSFNLVNLAGVQHVNLGTDKADFQRPLFVLALANWQQILAFTKKIEQF